MQGDQLTYFTSSLIGSITAFALYKVIRSQSQASKYKNKINIISSTPIKSPDEPFVTGQTVIVKGTANRNLGDSRNDRIVREVAGKKDEYIVHIKYKQAIYSNENFSNKEEYVVDLRSILGKAQISFSPSFQISGQRNSLVVTNYDHANYSPMLQTIRWDNRKKRLNLSQKFQVLMLSYFRALGTLVVSDRGRPGYLRGIDIGTREIQTGLKVGSSIMALGTIGLTIDGQLFLQPNLLFKDRLTMVANLQDVARGHQQSRNFWLLVLILGGIYVCRRVYLYDKKHGIFDKIRSWFTRDKQNRKPTPIV